MATIWWDSPTFNHCLLIPPIIALAGLAAEAGAGAARAGRLDCRALRLVGVGALGWLLGEAASVAVARQAGLILMLQGAVVDLPRPRGRARAALPARLCACS